MIERDIAAGEGFPERPYSLAELYHLNTRIVPSLRPVQHLSEQALASGPWGLAIKRYPSAQKIPLPATDLEPALSLSEAIRSRYSVRAWEHRPMSLEQLGTLLRLGAGIVRTDELGGREAYYRASPSGGARYPIEIYPVVSRVEDLGPGVYHYNYPDHALDVLQQDEETEAHFLKCTTYPDYVKGSAVTFVMTAVLQRTMSKYSDRGYRYILLEAGHIAQNVCLLATALGLGTLCLAGYYDHMVEQMLWIDGLSEAAMYLITAGWPAASEEEKGSELVSTLDTPDRQE